MNIIGSATATISASTSAALPLNKSLCRTVQRERAKIIGGPNLPTDVHRFIIPEMFRNTLRGEQFIKFDFNENGQRILLFCTDKNLKILKKCKIWQGDGTFDVVPELFAQLYTIHGRYKKSLIPLVYIVTTDRTEETYLLILKKLCELQEGLNPTLLIVDFELSFINAFENIFPQCDIHGCFFHWCQCIWRHIQSLGMQKKYQEDEEFSFHVRNLVSLAFVKSNDVVEFYKALIDSEYFTTNKEYLDPLLKYFEPTWIMKVKRKHIYPPRYSVELWNCFECVINDMPRTNNSIEAWHRGFSAKINQSHATLWKFLKSLQIEQSLTENKINDILAKKIMPTINKKYVEINRRISDIIAGYDTCAIDKLEYMKSIALNVRL